jgi:hypothetical protein
MEEGLQSEWIAGFVRLLLRLGMRRVRAANILHGN